MSNSGNLNKSQVSEMLAKWQAMVNENFFELNEETVGEVLVSFHNLVDSYLIDEPELLGFVSSASRQVQMPPFVRYDSDEIAQYTTVLNMVVPNLASESPFIQALSLAFIPRLSMVLTPCQLQDVVTNLLASLEIYITAEVTLSACGCLIALYTIVDEILLRLDSLHLSLIDIFQQVLKHVKRLRGPDNMMRLGEGVASATVLKIAASRQFVQLAKADDVNIITKTMAELLAAVKAFQFRSEGGYTTLLRALREEGVAKALLRVPNYLSAALSYCASVVLQGNNVQARNHSRGFLARMLTMDCFLSPGEEENVLRLLKADLSEGLTSLEFKEMVKKCFLAYVKNYNVPAQAAVHIRIE